MKGEKGDPGIQLQGADAPRVLSDPRDQLDLRDHPDYRNYPV